MSVHPFVVVDGKLTDPDSGEIIGLTEGASGTLALESGVIKLTSEPCFRPEHTEIIVRSGTEVFVALEYANAFTDHLTQIEVRHGSVLRRAVLAASGKVTSDVRLLFMPDSNPRLDCKSVELDSFLEPFVSLNQAYTEASIKYETERRSHTGNIFRQVWVVTQDEGLKSLGELRDEAVARYNQRLAGIAKLGSALRRAARSLPRALDLPPHKIMDGVLELATIFESESVSEEDRARTKALIHREVTQLWKQGGRAGQ